MVKSKSDHHSLSQCRASRHITRRRHYSSFCLLRRRQRLASVVSVGRAPARQTQRATRGCSVLCRQWRAGARPTFEATFPKASPVCLLSICERFGRDQVGSATRHDFRHMVPDSAAPLIAATSRSLMKNAEPTEASIHKSGPSRAMALSTQSPSPTSSGL